jgi:hypothetical protein
VNVAVALPGLACDHTRFFPFVPSLPVATNGGLRDGGVERRLLSSTELTTNVRWWLRRSREDFEGHASMAT